MDVVMALESRVPLLRLADVFADAVAADLRAARGEVASGSAEC